MAAKDSKKKKSTPRASDAAGAPSPGFGAIAREWCDTLVFAFILAMFIRTFVVELFRIPSGSMSPTLIGDYIVEYDVDGNHEDDLVILDQQQRRLYSNAFLKHDGAYTRHVELLNRKLDSLPLNGAKVRGLRYDRICVNKLAYLFQGPRRGDIAVFKTPEATFNPDRPIFVKRVCVLPNETVDIEPYDSDTDGGRLLIDGEIVAEPPVYMLRRYTKPRLAEAYAPFPFKVPPEQYMMFGDNTWNSSDSRMWGPVPGINFKGNAFLRYWPLRGAGRLENFCLLERSHSTWRWVLFCAYLAVCFLLTSWYSRFDMNWKQSILRAHAR